ncbi:MAG: s-methyl-5-thioribose-1-phosphate isomerase [Actinomycetota bacterium]|nr:s-methyl-5-thioribose-1-phosphate isomerase [Actinomycetota bacterium]
MAGRGPFPVRWADGVVELIDQTLLPERYETLRCADTETLMDSIARLQVRGAPAIGLAAAYGVAAAAHRAAQAGADTAEVVAASLDAAERLRPVRPTSVNLAWACDRMTAIACTADGDGCEIASRLLDEARMMESEDRAACAAMGSQGADYLDRVSGAPQERRERGRLGSPKTATEPAVSGAPQERRERSRLGSPKTATEAAMVPRRHGLAVLTHCNTGALCTAGIGTAFGVVRTLFERGRLIHLWVDETRPLLQGARLTAWEALELGMPHAVVADAAAGSLLSSGEVDVVVVGADRIAASGDVANKIGTYALAVLCARHQVPFVVVAPTSSVDLTTASGAEIVVEQRAPDEVALARGQTRLAPRGSPVHNPAFDVTPAALVSALVTEKGVVEQPDGERLAAHLAAEAQQRP